MANGDRDHVTVDIEEMLGKARPLFTTDCCIYKVPPEIRQLNEDAYTPVVVSIGPFHHGNTKLLKMEGPKQLYCQRFIERSEASLDDLVSCVQELEPRFRRCYSENIELGVDELVKLILVDCGFIIELFIRKYQRIHDDDEAILRTAWLWGRIIDDLCLLENQLPFFVFEKLYNLAFASSLNDYLRPPFLHLVLYIFSEVAEAEGLLGSPTGSASHLTDLLEKFYFRPSSEGLSGSPTISISGFTDLLEKIFLQPSSEGLSGSPTSSIQHFTDLLRSFYLQPSKRRPSRKDGDLTLRYSASELKEAGVKFTVNKSSHSLLELEFSGGILKIPHIKVLDNSETRLRNAVALEQCHYPGESSITDYVMLLGYLIRTDKDADVLVKERIISGDNSTVVELFRGVWKNATYININTGYLQICDELNAYYEDPWHTKMATLRRDYCNTPWKTAASIAGVAVLILTVIQTICSILEAA